MEIMDAVKIKLKNISWMKPVLVISLIGNIALTGLFFSGCRQSAPVRSNYETQEGFNFSDCGYRFDKVAKTVCGALIPGLLDAGKEKRRENRIVTCKNKYTKWKFDSQSNCRLHLNQK